MRKDKWKIEKIEHNSYEISQPQEKQLIAELAKILYSHFCQLHKESACSDNAHRGEEGTGRKYA